MKENSTNKNELSKVLIVVGPSGVGKDTVMKKVSQKYPEYFKKGVTHTSRKMRPGEKEGYNYYYISKEDFLKLKKEDGFIHSILYNDNYYGLSKKELEEGTKDNKILYLIIDINGAQQFHDLNIPSNFVAILPPSEKVLKQRLIEREAESLDVIEGRLNTAKTEIRRINESNFFNIIIYNDILYKTVLDLEEKLKILYPQLK